MQKTLDTWLNINPSPLSEVNNKLDVFYLKKNMNDYNYAIWLNYIPEDTIFKKEIKWRGLNQSVIICSNFDCAKIDMIEQKDFTSILKSNLQKAIRRNDTENALKTSKTMIKLNYIEFIRRLSIIMLEDCILHQSFTTLVWMIAAYPHYQPNEYHIKWLYGIVNYLSQLKYRDYYLKEEYNFKNNRQQIDNYDNKYKSILYSLQFRTSYGGMKGDMLMIGSLTKIWKKRIDNNDKFLKFLEVNIVPYRNKILNIKKNQISSYAIDFHCCPQILTILHKKYDNYQLEDIKKAIWYHRSRLTIKDLIINQDNYNNQYINIWNHIKDDVEKICLTVIKRL